MKTTQVNITNNFFPNTTYQSSGADFFETDEFINPLVLTILGVFFSWAIFCLYKIVMNEDEEINLLISYARPQISSDLENYPANNNSTELNGDHIESEGSIV